jgi:outer membrane receptor protein involved in Fe transport
MRTLSRCLLISLLSAAALLAQSEAGAGIISGSVTDPSGAAVAGARVTATSTATGFQRTAETTEGGIFTLVRLPAGPYDVTVEKQGFKLLRRSGVVVNVGSVTPLDARLEIGAVTESVTVTAETGVVETTRSQTSTVVDEKLVRDLPINGRNFLDFTTLTPGVVRDPRGGDLSFGGQRGTVNSFLIDGADSNNLFFGQSTGRQGVRNPYSVSMDAVQEFQVNTNSFAPEIGRAAAGVVNVITKSGTNEVHGTGFFFYRDTNLNANNAINKTNNRPRAPYKFRQFGGNIGGPVVKNKAFFFFNYDGQRNSEPVVLVPPPGVVAALPTLPAEAQAAYNELTSKYYKDYSRGLDNDVYLLKGDFLLPAGQTLNVRWNANRFTGRNFENAGAQRASEATGDSKAITDSLVAAYSRTIGPSRLWEVRYNYTRDDQPGAANSNAPETTVQQGGQTIIVFGRNNFSPRYTNSKRNQAVSTFTWTFGRHTMKFGGDFNFERIENFFPGQFAGVYLFSSLLDYAQKRPATFQQALPGPGTSGPLSNPNLNEYAFFIQDQWRVNPRLTLNYGLRYDLLDADPPPFLNPDPVLAQNGIRTNRLDLDRNNWGPRVGAAWRVFDSDRLVLRGGWGLFYGRTPAILTGTVHTNNGVQVQNYLFSGAAIPVTYPNILTAIPPTGRTPVNIFHFGPDFDQPQSQQLSFNIEGRAAGMLVTTGYLGVFGRNLNRSRDINLAPMQPLTGLLCTTTVATAPCNPSGPFAFYRRTAPRPIAGYQRITRAEDTGESNYNGVFIQVSRRMARDFSLQTSYTFSKVIDNAPEGTAVLPGNFGDDSKIVWDPLNIALDRGIGDADIRHRWVFSGVWDIGYANRAANPALRTLLGHWQLSSIIQAQSGRVFSPRIGQDLNNDGNIANERVPFAARNSLRLPAFVTLDLRLAKDIPLWRDSRVSLKLLGEAFNLANRANITGKNAVQYNVNVANFEFRPNAAYLFDTTAGDPRILQLALRLTF